MEYEWDQKKGFRPSPDLSDIQIFLAQMKRKNSLFMLIGILVWIVNFLGIFFLPNLFSCYVLPGPHHTEWWTLRLWKEKKLINENERIIMNLVDFRLIC